MLYKSMLFIQDNNSATSRLLLFTAVWVQSSAMFNILLLKIQNILAGYGMKIEF